jgi:hypothetical protein
MRVSKRAVPVDLIMMGDEESDECQKHQKERWENDDVDPATFSATVRGMWCRLPECIKSKIQSQLSFPPMEDVDGSVVACAVATTCDQCVLKRIRTLVYTPVLVSFETLRLRLARYYTEHSHLLRQDQKDLLAGSIAHMCPKEDRYVANADRVIGSAIACGGDFDAFQFFHELLKSSIKLNPT